MRLTFSRVLPVLFTLPLLPAQAREETKIEVLGGTVAVDYTSTKLKGRSPESLPVGGVWRMSKDAAAQLTTTVALQTRDLILPPGKYRLSARRTGAKSWSLLIFEEGMIFQPGVPYRQTALRLDEESESREDLHIRLRSSRTTARFKLHWGKVSLNVRLKALKTYRVPARLGGKPAQVTLFALPVARTQAIFSAGTPLVVGEARLVDDSSIRYAIEARRQGNGASLVFSNASSPRIQAAIDDLKAQRTRAAKGSAGNQARLLARMEERIKPLAARLDAAKDFASVVTVPATVADAAETAPTLVAKGRQTLDRLVLTLTFGAKDATFEVRDASFKRGL